MTPNISLFCASIRPHNWEKCLNSLRKNEIKYEVVMAGFIEEDMVKDIAGNYPEFNYIKTANIKPAQAYEVARRACGGDWVSFISDDCEYPENYLDKIHPFLWKQSAKTLVDCQTEDPECQDNDIHNHRFFMRNVNTPRVAQIGFIERTYLESLGGFDKKYIYGKFETDLSMRVWADGGQVVPYTEQTIKIEHTNKNAHINNDWSGVNQDSEYLEKTWVIGGYQNLPNGMLLYGTEKPTFYFPVINREVTLKRQDDFEPYEDNEILTKTQGNNILGRWE